MSDEYYKNRDEAPYGIARLGDSYTLMDVFDKFPKREKNFNNYYGVIFISTFFCIAGPCLFHHFMDKPFFYQPLYKLLSGGIGATGTYFGLELNLKKTLRTEAICRDYLQKNPDLFPPIGMF